MKIEGAIPRGQPTTMDGVEVRWASPPPVVYPPSDDQYARQDVPPRRPALLRGTLSSLRYQALQNAPATRANTAPPGPNSTDSQLAGELERNFGELHSFFKDGRLTQSSLRQLAAETLLGD
ncbi:hypothetical protein [Pseudomonas costantinii]|uniref:Uncharacterized protein n=1 Tax=Pseudomonas costantinii TaxID=168469 RepID=A0A1S2V556_9PSED|nr:hypothetical protein [Pseudomonas costantinii]NVZ22330.1 hypothetical protein [Pseudomonas costantinii]OIN53819.1 hypothetical protein BFL40_08210 [Pseudomonas costantinii]SEE43297.1 hypothetical protein SAMN04515675_5506 [Pseudomonas costantinii]